MKRISDSLKTLADTNCLRKLPEEIYLPDESLVDFTSNDYLGLAMRDDLQSEFLDAARVYRKDIMSSSASRLLHPRPDAFVSLENTLSQAYRSEALIFNSGYHANVGVMSALADKNSLILADKLIHASMIDGAMLSRGEFKRFNHNDINHLSKILEKEHDNYSRILIAVESVYSMDGDVAPLEAICRLKYRYDNVMIILDEAHAVGVMGSEGLGVAETLSSDLRSEVDIRILTFGKALNSSGAAVITSGIIKRYLINHARSLIFSTAIPPIMCMWTEKMFNLSREMDSERTYLKRVSSEICNILDIEDNTLAGHIIPVKIGSAQDTMVISQQLREKGFKVMGIRPPTVPAGTSRLRLSISASHDETQLTQVSQLIKTLTR